MTTQMDMKARIVALENLTAMCKHISGWAHTFEVSKVSRSRVHVTYSNPDEYGNSRPVTAVFPCYPGLCGLLDVDNPTVILEPIRVYGPDADWQMFYSLESCPTLFRGYVNNVARWRTHQQILREQGKTDMDNRQASGKCPCCYVCDVSYY